MTTMEKYDVLYLDPPWQFKVWSRDTGEGRSAASHYPVLNLDAIKALPIGDLASDNSAIFLWGCNSMLPEVLEVIKAWGFTYKTIAFTWVKTNKKKTDSLFWGMGFWSRQNSEFCLLATRGNPSRASKGVHSVVWDQEFPEAVVRPVMAHSAKPPEIRDRIVELMGPDKRYLEIFARPDPAIPPIWSLMGNEIDGLDIRDAIAKRLAEPV